MRSLCLDLPFLLSLLSSLNAPSAFATWWRSPPTVSMPSGRQRVAERAPTTLTETILFLFFFLLFDEHESKSGKKKKDEA